MTDTMKALAKTKPEIGLELIDAPIPVAGPEDVLIKVKRTAVCGTDIHIWNWVEWSQKNVPVPMALQGCGFLNCDKCYDADNSLLDVIVSGCKVFGSTQVLTVVST